MTARRVRSVGLLYETEEDLLGSDGAGGSDETHYHWREPEEIGAVEATLTDLGLTVLRVGSLEKLIAMRHEALGFDLAWNLSIRTTTRSRTAVSSALLEVLDVPYTGADAVSRALSLNKDYWKPIARQLGIHTPDWVRHAAVDHTPEPPPWPEVVVKPVCEGYSLGVVKLTRHIDRAEYRDLIRDVRDRFQVAVLCERFIAGRECVVAVVGHDPATRLMSMSELKTGDGAALGTGIVGLTEKRGAGLRRAVVERDDPAALPMINAAAALMDLVGPADYATFDFRVDESQRPYLIDINLDATLHPHRALAQSFSLAGVTYEQVIASILASAVDRTGLQL